MKLRRARTSAALAVGAAVATLALSISPGSATTTTPTKIFGSGSDVAYKVQVGLDTAYNGSPGCNTVAPSGTTQPLDFSCLPDTATTTHKENYAHDQVTEAFPIGASNGILQICGGLAGVDFARNTRTFGSSDCTGLHMVAYARDGAAWECFGTCHGVSNLTKAQLQGIYGDCSINNWSQVGGSAGPIKVYSILPGSGLKKVFESYLGISDMTHCSPDSAHIIFQNTNVPVLANGDQADAIVIWSIGVHFTDTHNGKDGSKLGQLEGVPPTTANVSNGNYPAGYYLSNVYCFASTGASPCPHPANAQVKLYIGESGTADWICKISKDHITNPVTGKNFEVDIRNIIVSFGMAPLALGATGGSATGNSYCREFDH
jgi:ABC-type phosphate transport system substrate-binding protein